MSLRYRYIMPRPAFYDERSWHIYVWDSETNQGTYYMKNGALIGQITEQGLNNWLADFPETFIEIPGDHLVDVGL